MTNRAIKEVMSEICERRNGRLVVTQDHLRKAIKTRRNQQDIGQDNRASKIRNWLAREEQEGRADLRNEHGARWTLPAAVPLESNPDLDREEAMEAIMEWAATNEEPPRDGPMILRKEKRAQLRTARGRLWSRLGAGSLNAAILFLILAGRAIPEADPSTPEWINQAAQWAVLKGWTERSTRSIAAEAAATLKPARRNNATRDGNRHLDMILDMGEGWASVGIAAEEMGCATIGVDKVGLVYQGTRHGHIRARVQIDFCQPGSLNLLRRIAKKAEFQLRDLLMVWLSPECTLLSRANSINMASGNAHGPYAESPENRAAATPERLEEERKKFAECKVSIEAQLSALEQEGIMFALENPMGSFFWKLPAVTDRIARLHHKGWRTHRVDQCAFGREAQKPTMILTNIPWEPEGLTGTGRCKTGMCTGTQNNTPGLPGAAKHSRTTMAATADGGRATRGGDHPKGTRGEYSVQAARNMVAPLLVQSIIEAARQQRERDHSAEN